MALTLRTAVACGALLIACGSAQAATEQQCLSLWKTADIDADGALSAAEDKSNYLAAAEKSGRSLQTSGQISRDEFLQLCAADAFAAAGAPAAASPGPASSRDLGKGDLTPAMAPLSEADARDKLTASGFREIQNLRLDESRIWRGTAVANGQRQDVAVDAQGDIVAKTAQGSPNPPPRDPGDAAAEPGPSPTPPAAMPELTQRGSPGAGGLLLWTFLLIGNAAALFILSAMTSSGTSAMSSRTDASAFA